MAPGMAALPASAAGAAVPGAPGPLSVPGPMAVPAHTAYTYITAHKAPASYHGLKLLGCSNSLTLGFVFPHMLMIQAARTETYSRWSRLLRCLALLRCTY